MKRYLPLLLFFVLGATLTFGCYRFQIASAAADTPVLADAGSAVVSTATEKPSDKLHDITSPSSAFDDAKAARKLGWPALVFAVLVIVTKGLAYGKGKLGSIPLLGRLATWLATGRSAMVVAAVGALGAAGYDTIVAGGSPYSAAFAGVIAALAVYNPFHSPPATA